MRQQLSIINRMQPVFTFRLDYDSAFHNQVSPEAAIKSHIFVDERTGFWRSTLRPNFCSSYARQASYADSSSPGPSSRWILIAAPMISRVRSGLGKAKHYRNGRKVNRQGRKEITCESRFGYFGVTLRPLRFTLRPLRLKAF